MKQKQLITSLGILLLVFFEVSLDAQSVEFKSGYFNHDSITAPKHIAENKLWLGFDAEPQYQNVIRNSPDFPQFSPNAEFTGGLLLYYQLAHTLGFETGLQYVFTDTRRYSSKAGPIWVNSPSWFYEWRSEDKLHSLLIPLLINLHTNGHKIRFYTAFGFAGGMNIIAKHYGNTKGFSGGTLFYDSTNVQWVKTNTGLIAAFIARAGVELNASENVMVKIGADFNIGTTFSLGSPYYNDTPVLNEVYPYPVNPYSIGLNVAVLFRTKTPKGKMRN